MSMSLLLAVLGSCLLTIALKAGPLVCFSGRDFPPLLRRWLGFVPAAVMAALVGPDIFIYNGQFNAGASNLFLMVSIPCLIFAIWCRNYFAVIALGLFLVITARFFGLY